VVAQFPIPVIAIPIAAGTYIEHWISDAGLVLKYATKEETKNSKAQFFHSFGR
jgi:hypothetical protein